MIHESIRGMKVELTGLTFCLYRHAEWKRKKDKNYHRRGAEIALKISKLQSIIKQMQVIELMEKLNELRKVA